jgi:hypothetical protein
LRISVGLGYEGIHALGGNEPILALVLSERGALDGRLPGQRPAPSQGS